MLEVTETISFPIFAHLGRAISEKPPKKDGNIKKHSIPVAPPGKPQGICHKSINQSIVSDVFIGDVIMLFNLMFMR